MSSTCQINLDLHFLFIIHRNMSSFFKNSQARQHYPFSTISLNQHYLLFSANTSPMSKTVTNSFSKNDKHSKQTTDLKAFKEKFQISDSDPPISCFRLITTPQPKLFISLNDLNKIDFPVLSYTTSELINFTKLIIDATPQRKAIGKSFNLNKLIQLISQNYNITAYHNFAHAFSLLLMLFQSYNRCSNLKKMLSEKEWFYVFIAALMHDLNHPGTTNAFEVKKQSQYAVEAKNVSVLQKMHLNQMWSLLKKNSQVNFLQGYPSYEAAHIKHIITRMVLSTDVAFHFKNLQSLRSISSSAHFEGTNAFFVVEQLFHASDIGNPCLDFSNYMSWGALVTFEFDQVAKKEKQLGLEVTSYLQYKNLKGFYAGQVGFCKGLVLPLWRELAVILPGLSEMTTNIEQNIVELQRRANDKQSDLIESGQQ